MHRESLTVSLSIAGIREPAGNPLPGDVRQECDQRGAGVHDDGRGDQEPCRTSVQCRRIRGKACEDRFRGGRGQQQVRVLLDRQRGRWGQMWDVGVLSKGTFLIWGARVSSSRGGVIRW